jgi:hypothetical protein
MILTQRDFDAESWDILVPYWMPGKPYSREERERRERVRDKKEISQ